jgi:hypothetical protein
MYKLARRCEIMKQLILTLKAMKKVILLSLLAVLFACEKDDTVVSAYELRSLTNTEWIGVMLDYYNGMVVVKVISNTEATMTAGVLTMSFNYTFDSSLKTGTLTSEGNTFIYEVMENTLILSDSYGDKYYFTQRK